MPFSYPKIPVSIQFPTRNFAVKQDFNYQQDSSCDVFYVHENAIDQKTHNTLKKKLDEMASKSGDHVLWNYQNIIDPNMLVQDDKWIATDFLVETVPNEQLVRVLREISTKILGEGVGPLPLELIIRIISFTETDPSVHAQMTGGVNDLDPIEHVELHECLQTILTASLPLLSKLRKPAIILPGKLQAVIKAQRIYLSNAGDDYEGVWHRDGEQEDIIGVVLYYYRVTSDIEGGQLEFIDRRPIIHNFWMGGDCTPTNFSKESAMNVLKGNQMNQMGKLPRCKVDVKEGSLIVFSNYQLVHRVLKMQINSTGDKDNLGFAACRDFVAFFIVDQRVPLISTAEYFSEHDYPQKNDKVTEKKRMESLEQRRKKRMTRLLSQLIPSGYFGLSADRIYSTGNGSLAQLAWMEKNLQELSDEDVDSWNRSGLDREGLEIVKKMNEMQRIT
eukprot:TRINITY_DN1194_c0_g1_i2.p1 TRINITY_DN1194_c0_g1~~TRINITY_DN1194_c0_g1_i2.p1  ORF type:complete len:445 (+),score=87.64 TRINITY_DN1194_c0_g1_i2:656-1990(+)